MTREDVKQTMLLAMSEQHSGNAEEAIQIVDAQIAALEAAGVRLVPEEATVAMIKASHPWNADGSALAVSMYRAMLAAKHHPDKGGDPAKMAEINAARDEALKELGG